MVVVLSSESHQVKADPQNRGYDSRQETENAEVRHNKLAKLLRP